MYNAVYNIWWNEATSSTIQIMYSYNSNIIMNCSNTLYANHVEMAAIPFGVTKHMNHVAALHIYSVWGIVWYDYIKYTSFSYILCTEATHKHVQ